MNEEHAITAPAVKLVSVWGSVGIAALISYAQLISLTLASLYTACLLGEWVWKKFFKPRKTKD